METHLEGATARIERLLDAGLILTQERSLPAVLERIVALAAEITRARYAALGVLADDRTTISEFITVGVTEEQRRAIGSLPVGKGLLGLLIEDARPIRVRDITTDPRSSGFPPNHPQMRSFLGAPIAAHGEVFGNIYLTEKMGAAEFDEEDEKALTILAAQAGIAVENARLYEEGRQREARLEGIREISTAILAGEDQARVLGLVARKARELAGADLATIAIPLDERTMALHVVDGLGADHLRHTTFPREDSLSGQAMRAGEAVVLEDSGETDRCFQPIATLTTIGPVMFVPLATGERTLGTLAVANQRGRPHFGPDVLTLVAAFADQAAVALSYGEARSQLQRLALMEDRERIAKELHDGIIQALFAVGMGLQATAAGLEDTRAAERIEGAVQELDGVIRDLRGYIFELRPGLLAHRRLDGAMRSLAADLERASGMSVVVDIDADTAGALGDRAADVVQITREALSNVRRHAEAATCRVSLRRSEGGAVLEVEDDGRGFDPADPNPGGQGMGNLQERAAALGGRLELDSTPGEGTSVRVRIPI